MSILWFLSGGQPSEAQHDSIKLCFVPWGDGAKTLEERLNPWVLVQRHPWIRRRSICRQHEDRVGVVLKATDALDGPARISHCLLWLQLLRLRCRRLLPWWRWDSSGLVICRSLQVISGEAR